MILQNVGLGKANLHNYEFQEAWIINTISFMVEQVQYTHLYTT